MGKLITEFKEFVMRGNVMDLAVGVIIGGAFGSIVTSLCDDVIMPGISWLLATVTGMDLKDPETGNLDFTKVTGALKAGPIDFGKFAAAIINFLIMAIIIFIMVKAVNKIMTLPKALKKGEEEEEAPTTKECPFCFSEIDIKATRCPHCTSVLPEIVEEALKEDEKKADAKA